MQHPVVVQILEAIEELPHQRLGLQTHNDFMANTIGALIKTHRADHV